VGEGEKVEGRGHNGQPFEFHWAQPVDASGQMPGGASFGDIRAFKQLLLEDPRAIARNVLGQLTVYATGAPVRLGDRPDIEAALDRSAPSGYGFRSMIHELVQSRLMRHK
jgi:hypothetical protein